MKRVLAFHGHTENAHTFSRKLADVRAALKDDIEFVFLDAPNLLTPIDPQGKPIFSSSEAFESIRNLDPKNPTPHTPRGWFRQRRDAGDSPAVSESLAYVRKILERDGPFQGVMGFSQGGAFAGLVGGLLERPDHTPHFKGINHPPLEFIVLFAGYKLLNPGFANPKNLKTPTLFVMGSNDAIVLPEHTHDLITHFDSSNVRIEYHTGGHFVPRKPEWRAFIINYLKAWSNYPVSAAPDHPLYTPFASSSSSAIIPWAFFKTAAESEGRSPKKFVIKKARKQSWTEVVPKTVWEGGVDPEDLAKNLLGIDESDNDGDFVELPSVKFDPAWNVNAAQKAGKAAKSTRRTSRGRALSNNTGNVDGRVHFFEDAPPPLKPVSSANLKGMDSPPVTMSRYFGPEVEKKLRERKVVQVVDRKLSQDPRFFLVRVTGGREILVPREEMEKEEFDYGTAVYFTQEQL